jgi:hypothetical protein
VLLDQETYSAVFSDPGTAVAIFLATNGQQATLDAVAQSGERVRSVPDR